MACDAGDQNNLARKPLADRIDCAVDGAVEFTRTCAIDRPGDTVLILRHTDGGFRRIDLASDGTLSAADGSDAADGKPMSDGRFELIVGGDRYRLPPRK